MAKRKTAKQQKASASKLDLVDSAHQIWLAGVGAMARAQQEGPKVFQALVSEGTKVQNRTSKATQRAIQGALQNIQSTVNAKVTQATDKAQETWDNIEKIFQSRVQKAIHQLGVPSAREINALTRKVDELTKSVEKLSAGQTKRSTPIKRRAVAKRIAKTAPRRVAVEETAAAGSPAA